MQTQSDLKQGSWSFCPTEKGWVNLKPDLAITDLLSGVSLVCIFRFSSVVFQEKAPVYVLFPCQCWKPLCHESSNSHTANIWWGTGATLAQKKIVDLALTETCCGCTQIHGSPSDLSFAQLRLFNIVFLFSIPNAITVDAEEWAKVSLVFLKWPLLLLLSKTD